MDNYVTALRAYILDTGISQRKLAELLGVRESAVSRWLSGQNSISLSSRHKIDKLLGAAPSPICCPLQSSQCPVFNDGDIDYESAYLWASWKKLSDRQRSFVISSIARMIGKP